MGRQQKNLTLVQVLGFVTEVRLGLSGVLYIPAAVLKKSTRWASELNNLHLVSFEQAAVKHPLPVTKEKFPDLLNFTSDDISTSKVSVGPRKKS
jgi:hypothetical protein